MVKKSTPDEIVLDDIMKESMKEMGKGEIEQEPIEQKTPAEAPKEEVVKPQFGFKLGEVKTPESFVVDSQKEKPKTEKKEQVILDKPSQSLDDDIIVEW
tara:strand:+ start:105 stop:401 length:297 start_codon:yes stop_codon:yes gene_type:complete